MKDLSLKQYEQFSAYLDGQLSPGENRKLEEQLTQNPDWRLALDELRATRAILRRAPQYRAPRNFTISPEVARQYARRSWLPSFISFRLSSAVAALSVIAVMLLQFLPAAGLGARVSMSPAAADVPSTAALAAPTQDVSKAAQETAPQLAPAPTMTAAAESPAGGGQPPVINWSTDGGTISSGQGLGRGGATGIGGGGGGGGDASSSAGIVGFNKETIGSPMYGGGGAPDNAAISPGPNGGIVNYAGVPSPDQPGSAGVYSPPYNLPPQSAESLPEQPAQTISPSQAAGLEGSGPILGVASADTAGQIIAEGPITSFNQAEQPRSVLPATEAAQPIPSFWTTTRIVQAGLLGLALLAGVVAILARRRAP